MSYIKTTNFEIKDSYLTGNPAKVVKGAEIDTEFNNIATNFNGVGPLDDAAAATLQTSVVDTTPGRVLTVGAFGLGAGDAIVFSGDFDTLKTTGLWGVVGASTNGPAGWGGGTCYVIARTVAGGATSQIASDANSGKAWIRQQGAGAWGIWREFWTTANLVKTTSATDTTADSMLKVGDFGLGGLGVTFTDFNVLMGSTASLFGTAESSVLNPPLGIAGETWTCLYTASLNADRGVQLATALVSGRVFSRVRLGGATGAWQEVATSANSLGQGQTWQNVTGSRVAATTYTNSTGRTIELAITGAVGGVTSGYSITVNGVVIYANNSTDSVAGSTIGGTLLVPNGATYLVTATPSISKWMELR